MYIYLAEVIIKIIGFGLIDYFSVNWNKYDFLVTIISIAVSASFSPLKLAKNTKFGTTARLMRFSRILKEIKSCNLLQKIKIL